MTQEKKITDDLFLPTILPKQSDLAIILGTRYTDPIPYAINLYQEEIVPKILLTGGINRHTGINEAQHHFDLLRAENIPESAIIVEDQSTNTLENITFSLELLKKENLLKDSLSIIIIAKWFHAKRVLMTFRAHYPSGTKYYLQNYDVTGITPENWYQSEETYDKVASNWHKIPKYLEKGDVAPISFNGEYFY